ncbi:MAG: Bacterial domain [Chloroflexi bacterium]|nr:Bacterial domain [Chloroflexota bacterium]
MRFPFGRSPRRRELEDLEKRADALGQEVAQLEAAIQGPGGDADSSDAYRSVRRLRESMARQELTGKQTELDQVLARIAALQEEIAERPTVAFALPTAEEVANAGQPQEPAEREEPEARAAEPLASERAIIEPGSSDDSSKEFDETIRLEPEEGTAFAAAEADAEPAAVEAEPDVEAAEEVEPPADEQAIETISIDDDALPTVEILDEPAAATPPADEAMIPLEAEEVAAVEDELPVPEAVAFAAEAPVAAELVGEDATALTETASGAQDAGLLVAAPPASRGRNLLVALAAAAVILLLVAGAAVGGMLGGLGSTPAPLVVITAQPTSRPATAVPATSTRIPPTAVPPTVVPAVPPTAGPTANAEPEEEEAPEPSAAAVLARVTVNYSVAGQIGARMRSQPTSNSTLLRSLNNGVQVDLLSDAVTGSDGFRWVRVRALDGQEGWVVSATVGP